MIRQLAQIDINQIRTYIKSQHPAAKDVFLPPAAPAASSLTQITGILNLLIPYLFVIAGLILFFFLIDAGIHMLTSANNPDGIKEAKAKAVNALVGFLLLFCSYWLIQIVEKIFGIGII